MAKFKTTKYTRLFSMMKKRRNDLYAYMSLKALIKYRFLNIGSQFASIIANDG